MEFINTWCGCLWWYRSCSSIIEFVLEKYLFLYQCGGGYSYKTNSEKIVDLKKSSGFAHSLRSEKYKLVLTFQIKTPRMTMQTTKD